MQAWGWAGPAFQGTRPRGRSGLSSFAGDEGTGKSERRVAPALQGQGHGCTGRASGRVGSGHTTQAWLGGPYCVAAGQSANFQALPAQPGEFCEVFNGSKTDPCAWLGRIVRFTKSSQIYMVSIVAVQGVSRDACQDSWVRPSRGWRLAPDTWLALRWLTLSRREKLAVILHVVERMTVCYNWDLFHPAPGGVPIPRRQG